MKRLFFTSMMILSSAIASQAMATGDIVAGKTKSTACIGCHGSDGNSRIGMFPKLAGQGEAYLIKQLVDMKTGLRKNPVMTSIVAKLSDQDMADLAAYFSSHKRTPDTESEDTLNIGKTLYTIGNTQSGVPACMACHGSNGEGIPVAKWPALSGQHSSYVETQLKAFAADTRTNDPNSAMRDIAKKLTEEEIKAVAAYVAGLH